MYKFVQAKYCDSFKEGPDNMCQMKDATQKRTTMRKTTMPTCSWGSPWTRPSCWRLA